MDYTRYNNLPEVEKSDARLREISSFPHFLEEAKEVMMRYNLEDYIGLRLIHKHFPVKEGQVMQEIYQDYKGIPSLITCAEDEEKVKHNGGRSASWIFSDLNEFYSFEASTDPAVREGISLMKRSSLEFVDYKVYLEVNNFEKDQSIVQLASIIEIDPTRMIGTS